MSKDHVKNFVLELRKGNLKEAKKNLNDAITQKYESKKENLINK